MTQTTYEETRYLMEEREIRSGNRERVEEERWTRGRPIGSTRYTPLSERIPVQRVVEDYRRTDYRYNDHVPSFAPYCLQHLEDAHPVAHPVAHPAVHESTQLISSARSTSEVKIECKF
ncbi:hypothetical protein RB195_010415 [Necator americanus]|uniref:Uncharacterized protein n=1 Tax=Necator americanus TaxID=51031 RepID=A0ABR1CXU1_NECAM